MSEAGQEPSFADDRIQKFEVSRMVYLAITPTGLAEALGAAQSASTVWCGADAISEEAYAAIPPGDRPTRFIYDLGDRFLLEDAVGTIREHHPGHSIWIEAAWGADAEAS